jgi:glutathione S-transferase
MITVHHLNNSRSQRVLWLLEELGVGYEVKHYQRDPETMLAPPELLAVHPLGKSPVITDGTHTIAESGAIIEYLVDRYGDGRLKPALGSPERLRYTYWLHFRRGLGHAAIAVAADIQPDRGRSHAVFCQAGRARHHCQGQRSIHCAESGTATEIHGKRTGSARMVCR